MSKQNYSGWKATIAVSMSNYIEAGSIIALATSLTMWQHYFGFSNLFVGFIAAVSANAFGAAVGAMIGGPLGDRYGRKFIYTYDLILYMIGTVLVIFAVTPWMLVLGVILTGIAVGAGVPVAWTYIAEEAPAHDRARHVGSAQLAWSLGPALVFLFATFLVPLGLLGSRIVFAHLFVVAFVTWWIRRGLSESESWKRHDAERKKEEAQGIKRRNYKELLTDKRNVKALLFLTGVYGLWNLVAGQMGIFMPRVYETAGVESGSQQNLLQVLLWTLTVFATYFGFMKYGDRMNRRTLYAIGAILGIAAWVLLVFVHITMPMAEMFPTRYRASAQGVLFFTARIIVGLLSYWFPTLLAERGVPFVGMIMIGALVIALVVGFLGAPDTRGKTLEEIEEERFGTSPSKPRALQAETSSSTSTSTVAPSSSTTQST